MPSFSLAVPFSFPMGQDLHLSLTLCTVHWYDWILNKNKSSTLKTLPEEGVGVWSRARSSKKIWETFHVVIISPFLLFSILLDTQSLLFHRLTCTSSQDITYIQHIIADDSLCPIGHTNSQMPSELYCSVADLQYKDFKRVVKWSFYFTSLNNN